MFKTKITRILFTLFLATCIVSSSGCIGALAQLLYVVRGHKVPPAYDGLNGKKIAVVCISDASAYGPDTLTYTISNALSIRLAQGLKSSTVVIPVSKIEDWIDNTGWNEQDFVALGRGVGADAVVAVDVKSYTLKEGSTLLKGKADITATVYNVEKEGQVDYQYGPSIFEYPKNGGRPAIQTTDRQFEAVYLGQLINLLTNQFCEHDKLENFASDAISNY